MSRKRKKRAEQALAPVQRIPMPPQKGRRQAAHKAQPRAYPGRIRSG